MASNIKNPPTFDSNGNFENWEKSLKLWQLVTNLTAEKQGPAIVLALSGKARDLALELTVEQIGGATGVELILEKLRKVYKKDSIDSAYEAFEKFIYYQKEENVSMSQFINEFEARYNKAKTHGCELSSSILAFFLLDRAKLSKEHQQLIRASK